MTIYRTFFIAISALLICSIAAAGADQSGPSGAEQNQLTEAIRSFFAAAAADDLDKLHAVTTPDFYAFDAGGRFTRDPLMDMIKTAHVAGKVYVWTVNEPEVHISGDMGQSWLHQGRIRHKRRDLARISCASEGKGRLAHPVLSQHARP